MQECPMSRNRFPVSFALGLAILLLPSPEARAQDSANHGLAAQPNQVTGKEITEEQKHSVELGLAWLARRQEGSVSGGAFTGYTGQAGLTALAGLAFMEAGNLPGTRQIRDARCRSASTTSLPPAAVRVNQQRQHDWARCMATGSHTLPG